MPDRLPSLFIAGAPKSGTTSVFRWLDDHPQARGSVPKETNFFADPETEDFDPKFNVRQGLDQLHRAFQGKTGPDQMLFEGTAVTIYSQTALGMIPDLPNAPKCLFILREPAAQILSTFTYFKNNWAAIPPEVGFEDFLSHVRSGKVTYDSHELLRDALANADYLRLLQPWRDRLGTERMMVRTFDALREDPRSFMADLADWCGIAPEFYDTYDFAAENESYVPRSRALQQVNVALRERLPKGVLYGLARRIYRRLNTRRPAGQVDPEVMAALRAEFAAKNRQLSKAFDLDLSGWSD
ncbi:MAG: hypothetical protein HKN30_00995 [Sulfitobacter sp.]|nr:hypothetical protein [Sulfitobacter sp.]